MQRQRIADTTKRARPAGPEGLDDGADRGATIDETHQAILGARFTPVETHLPDAQPGAQAVFVQAFAVEPDARPGSAAALLRQFEQGVLPS